MRQSFYEFCCVNGKQQLLDEWDDARNLPLTPQTVTYGSRIAAWWRCRYGHSWSAAIYTRTEGAACPYCAGRRVLLGYNDLASVHPELVQQWDHQKNMPLQPEDISAGSQRIATLLMHPTDTTPDTLPLRSAAFCSSCSCAASMVST